MDPLQELIGIESEIVAWTAQVFVVIFIALLADFIQKRALGKLYQRLLMTDSTWDDAFVDALRRPLSLLIWILGIAFAAEIVRQQTDLLLFEAVKPLREIGVITALAWFLVRVATRVEQNVVTIRRRRGEAVDRTTVAAIGKLTRISILITAGLVMLQTLWFSVSGVLAFGGVGGIAVGFAAKDLLANFFGGLMIYLDRPFAVGDWIRSPDRDIEGTVEEIGWRLTRIRTFDKRPIYVPNATFTTIAVENPSRMTNRRIYEKIGIRYEDADKMAAIVDQVRTMLRQHEAIDPEATLIVNFNAFGASSLDFFVYTFTRTTNWIEFHEIKQDVLLRIQQIVTANGAEFAFPTTTVHLPDGLERVAGQPGEGPPRAG